jgi:PAS domain-containing protein
MDPVDISEDAQNILNAVPFPIFVMDVDLCVARANQAAHDLSDMKYILRRLCGEVLHCVHENQSGERCGNTAFCSACAIRNAVGQAWSENRVVHLRQEMIIYWEQVESYFTRYANVDFSHGLCPECAEKLGSSSPGTLP